MKVQYIHGGLHLRAESQKEALEITRMVKHSKSGLLWLNGAGQNTELDGFSSVAIMPLEKLVGARPAKKIVEVINGQIQQGSGEIPWAKGQTITASGNEELQKRIQERVLAESGM